jgi:uncharacterized protein with PQ loop repeat
MNTIVLENTLGFIYNFCFIVCYWPQIIKAIRRKSIKNVSLSLFTLSIIGYASAIGYTLLRVGYDFWWLFNYFAGGFSAITMVIVYFKYRKTR